jgi:hypothetical protein
MLSSTGFAGCIIPAFMSVGFRVNKRLPLQLPAACHSVNPGSDWSGHERDSAQNVKARAE